MSEEEDLKYLQTEYEENIITELIKKVESLQNKLQQKENIIKDVREFIYKCNDGKQGINYSGCSKLLEILDKERSDING